MGFLSGGSGSRAAQGLSGEREAVVLLHEPVRDGVSDGGIADPGVPMFDGQLAGDNGGAAPPGHC